MCSSSANGIAAGNPDQFEQKAEQVTIVFSLPFRAFEDLTNILQRVFDRAHVIGNEKGPDGRPTNHMSSNGNDFRMIPSLPPPIR